jgi:maltooligosyltrehalose trehalohydrolase
VVLESGGARRALRPAGSGWWDVEPGLVSDDADYTFRLDGGEPLPDPRAERLPHGVAGPGRRVDHARFDWTDLDWAPPPLHGGVVYELHVGTFSAEGTFDGASVHLDALVELGVTHVELMPVNAFPGVRGWGYDGVGLFAPHEPYGGPDGLKRFVNAAHARGLAVLLDVVYNHVGPGAPLHRFGPYFTSRHGTPWGAGPNLDGPGSTEVRRFLCDNALQWLRDYHVDGLRIDAAHLLSDRSPTHLLVQLRREVDALERETGRARVLVAEYDLDDSRLVRPRETGGFGLDAQWDDGFHHALHTVLTGEAAGYYAGFGRLADLAEAFGSADLRSGSSGRRARHHGRSAPGLSGHRFLGYLQNHDQVGNRARGERIGHLVTPDRQRVAAGLVLLSPLIPLLFQGEEWGASSPFLYFTDHADPALAEAVRAGRRRELAAFGWRSGDVPDPQAPETFECSRLDWEERAREPHAGLLEWYRRLIRLRRERPELCDGRLDRARVGFDERERWMWVTRGRVTIACNLGAGIRRLPLAEERHAKLLLASAPEVRIARAALELPPDSLAVLAWEEDGAGGSPGGGRREPAASLE